MILQPMGKLQKPNKEKNHREIQEKEPQKITRKLPNARYFFKSKEGTH
jgi:hypothetical protein